MVKSIINHRSSLIIGSVALLLVLVWPPAEGRSLGVKILNWVVDPRRTLPPFPAPLPIGLDDNGDAVAEHDALERDYYIARDRSALNRWRMDMKEWTDPVAPQTERQILVGIAVFGAFLAWHLNGDRLRRN